MRTSDGELNRLLAQWGQSERELLISQPRPPRTPCCPAPYLLAWFAGRGLPTDAGDELSHILQCDYCTRWFITHWLLEGRLNPDVLKVAERHPEGPTATLLQRLPELAFEWFEKIHGHVSPEPA